MAANNETKAVLASWDIKITDDLLVQLQARQEERQLKELGARKAAVSTLTAEVEVGSSRRNSSGCMA